MVVVNTVIAHWFFAEIEILQTSIDFLSNWAKHDFIQWYRMNEKGEVIESFWRFIWSVNVIKSSSLSENPATVSSLQKKQEKW